MKRVLVVKGPCPNEAQDVALILADAGFDVEVAPDAETAFARLCEERFDLVLSDLVLPGQSGFELCRRIKRGVKTWDVPVAVQTNQIDPLNVLRALEAGADGFTIKDREPADMIRRVQEAIPCGARTLHAGMTTAIRAKLLGEDFRLTAGPEQLVNVLLSAFEDVVELNEQYQASEAALRELEIELEKAKQALAEADAFGGKLLHTSSAERDVECEPAEPEADAA